jgi:carbonic anhydrase
MTRSTPPGPPLQIFFLLVGIFLAPLPALAAKWAVLDSLRGTRIEVDKASIVRENGDKLRVWHRETYAKPQVLDSGAFSYASLTVLTEFQCAKRLASPQRRTYFAADGREVKAESVDSKEAAALVPDSISEMVFLYACKPQAKTVAPPVAQPAQPAQPAEAASRPEPSPAEQRSTAKKNKAKSAAKEEVAHHEEAHWTYAGKTGAATWGKLSDQFAACGVGQRQSPIDVRDAIGADLPPIVFSYKAIPLSIVDNGHTIQVNAAGAGSIKVEGEDYELLQFHFHKPSEEKINGKTYDMVAHLVHKSQEGKLAVVAVLLQGGKEHKLIRTLWSNLPLEQNKPVVKSNVEINLSHLLPKNQRYYTFTGSLTTPPCTEGVLWLVLATPTELSKEQIADFGKAHNGNARPVQPSNGRIIKGSR